MFAVCRKERRETRRQTVFPMRSDKPQSSGEFQTLKCRVCFRFGEAMGDAVGIGHDRHRDVFRGQIRKDRTVDDVETGMEIQFAV